MTLSEQTQSVLAYFDKYSGFNLRKKNDIGRNTKLLPVVGAAEEFNALILRENSVEFVFDAAKNYLPNRTVIGTLNTSSPQPRTDDAGVFIVFALESNDDALEAAFEEIYLGVSQGTMRNLVDLAMICHSSRICRAMSRGKRE